MIQEQIQHEKEFLEQMAQVESLLKGQWQESLTADRTGTYLSENGNPFVAFFEGVQQRAAENLRRHSELDLAPRKIDVQHVAQLLTSLDSIAKGFLLTDDYFKSLSDLEFEREKNLFLLDPSPVSQVFDQVSFQLRTAGKFPQSPLSELRQGVNYEAFIDLIVSLMRVYELEDHRRNTIIRLNQFNLGAVEPLDVSLDLTETPILAQEPEQVFPLHDVAEWTEWEAPLESRLHEAPRESVNSPVRWKVKLSSRLAIPSLDVVSEAKAASLFQELVRRLEEDGPCLQKDKIKYSGLRNFSAIATASHVYHCHLGDSNSVAIWKEDPSERTIHIFYLGRHPNYKRLTR